MLSRLAQGMTSVLQELSGEENPAGGSEDGVNLQVPSQGDGDPPDLEGKEDTMERLAQMEQLVVRLKEMIHEKDGQLTDAERQLKEEREASEIRFSKLKLQAKAKMAALSKQISALKGQEGANTSQSADDSLTMAHGSEEALKQLRLRLQEEESVSRTLREQLEASERQTRDLEERCSEQIRALQAVVCEKDVRFREQVQKHEEELLSVTTGAQNDGELQQALRVAQRRTEELEEALRSRTQVLDMLQQELNSADEQKQILTMQFRQMEQELAEVGRQREKERHQWTQESGQTQEKLAALAQELEAAQRERKEVIEKEMKARCETEAELASLKEQLEAVRRQNEIEMKMKAKGEESIVEEGELRARLDAIEKDKEELERRVAELGELKVRLEAVMSEKEGMERRLETEAEKRVAELGELKVRLEAVMSEKEEMERRLETEAEKRVAELGELKVRLEAVMAEKEEMERRLETEAEKRVAELGELKVRLEAEMAEKEEMEGRLETEAERRVAELGELNVRLEAVMAEKEELEKRVAELNELRLKLQAAENEKGRKENGSEARLEGELTASKAGWDTRSDAQGHAEQGSQLLVELWMKLHILAGWKAEGETESSPTPTDSAQCEAVLQAVEARLLSLGAAEHQSQVDPTVEVLQGELAKYMAEKAESEARIQELEGEIGKLQDIGRSSQVAHPVSNSAGSVEQGLQELVDEEAAKLVVQSSVQQKTAEEEGILTDSHAHIVLAEPQESMFDSGSLLLDNTEQSHSGAIATHDKVEELTEFTADADMLDEEKTLIVEDLSPSAESGGSPELISLQPESPDEREMKESLSDEMVTSTDSVVQSSWTLLEAGNQEGTLEWTPSLQDFSQLHHQPWEQTIIGQHVSNSSTVHMQSSSVVIHESVHVNIPKQEEMTASQAFTQALAEELQRKYSDLLAELEKLREVASNSEVRLQCVQDEHQALKMAKEAAEARAEECEEALKEARTELNEVANQGSSEECHSVEYRVLEEQLASLQTVASSKEQKIQALQADLDKAQQYIDEQDCQARMLRAQIEDKEIASSELEQKLRDSEARLQDMEDLKLCLSQKEQEMRELTEAMSTKLLQAREEKFLINSEVTKLKEQVFEVEKAWEEERIRQEGTSDECGQIETLLKDKQDLNAQLVAMKKEGEQMKRKLQAALVQRKELMKKVELLEKGAEKMEEQCEVGVEKKRCSDKGVTDKGEDEERQQVVLKLETALEEANQTLRAREEVLEMLQQKIAEKEQLLTAVLVANQRQGDEAENAKSLMQNEEMLRRKKTEQERAFLQSQLTSLESEYDTLQKKLQEAVESQKETIRKAKEKDRHHREQMKHQKEEYNRLLERCEEQKLEKDQLQNQLKELEEVNAQNVKDSLGKDSKAELEKDVMLAMVKPEQISSGDWGQGDWNEFVGMSFDTDTNQVKPTESVQLKGQMLETTSHVGGDLEEVLKDDVQSGQVVHVELEKQLKHSQELLSLRETELLEVRKELRLLKEKEQEIDTLSLEMKMLREKCSQAEAQAEMLKAEVEERQRNDEGLNSPISELKGEVEEFKQFLDCKNNEILELSQQLGEQNSILQMMQETVSEKDQLIFSLQDSLRIEKEKNQKLEEQNARKQEEEKGDETKLQQLQRKLQAALISRKDALKESKMQKDELASLERFKLELQKRLEDGESELAKMRAEREKLIEEVDKTLLENQGLVASCESLKLAMEGVLKEKEEYKQEADAARKEAVRVGCEWEEKVQGLKEEYETLLKSYENVSDEAERVRRVLEVARQERQELLAKARAHETARQEAEQLAEEAQKEVETVKDKMRKFAKAKQQKIMDLEEENEKLREMEEKKDGAGMEYKKQKEELLRIKEEFDMLKADLDATQDERDLLKEEAADLRQKLAHEIEKGTSQSPTGSPSSISVVEEAVTFQQSSMLLTQTGQEQTEGKTQESRTTVETEVSVVDSSTHPPMDISKMEPTESTQVSTEEKIREIEITFEEEKASMLAQESELMAKIVSLEEQLQECKVKEMSLKDEIIKWETKYQDTQARLEAEKDDLEERLMNQLAQLNGSIAGYQQKAADSRERMVEQQRLLEKVEAEKAEFEAQAKAEKDRAAKLEEDKRQAQRERAEAEAEAGKNRELEQKLKSAQRGKEGSQSHARQLEELLREKQLEVRQMQKDCIQYQEKISEQEREAKALQIAKEQAQRELTAAHLEAATVTEGIKKVDAELKSCKEHLENALSEAKQAQAEKQASEDASLRREAEIRAEAEQTLDAVRLRLGSELKQMEKRLEEAQKEKERDERAAVEARQLADTRELHAQQVQSRLDESLARLAAFSRSMSSLQDDRDRVLDEARQWESRFHSTIQGKEAEVREAEARARDLGEQLQKVVAQNEELQLTVDSLQKAEAEWHHKSEEQERRYTENQSALEKERGALQEALSQVESSLAQKSTLLASLEVEAEGLRHRVQALEEAIGELQQELDGARTALREREMEERRLGLCLEQLETDLRSSKKLTEALQAELGDKEKREVELLGEKEQAVAQAADEAKREAEGRAQEAENEAERWREEARRLEERAHTADEESGRNKARLEAFTKAMGSLQDDRDGVLSQYKQLEERHLQVIVEKDALIQEAAAENNGLKEELRSLLAQRDDLNSEKAKLSAQLHGYRDDLTQVLSMKDSQYKQMLSGHLERISALEREKEEMQVKIQSLEKQTDVMEARVDRENLSQASDSEKQNFRDQEENVVKIMEEQLAASQDRVVELEATLHSKQEGDKERNKELSELRWEGGVLRTQAETAEERVAELARDLMEMEQKLLAEKEVAAQLQAQNKSFGQAMASLQDSRDQAVNEAQELRLRLEEMARTAAQPMPSSPPAGTTGEVWALKNALSALQNDRERLLEQLLLQQTEVSQLKEDAAELVRVTQELQEEKRKAEEALTREKSLEQQISEEAERMLTVLQEKDEQLERERTELEVLRLESKDWQAKAEVLKQQTLATLSERDEQVQQLSAMLEDAKAFRSKVSVEQYQREASSRPDLSSEGLVLQSGSDQLSSQLNDTLRELHMKDLKITELSSKLSQVFEEKRLLSSQLRGSSQRLGEAQSHCAALQRQLQELQLDKRKDVPDVDSAPGAPQERSDPSGSDEYRAEVKALQYRLDEEQEHRLAVEDQLREAQDRLKRLTQGEWQARHEGSFSETAVLIEPPEGTVTRTRSGGPGLVRMLRGAFCSRQRTPLLATLYLLTVHALLLLCLGGYL